MASTEKQMSFIEFNTIDEYAIKELLNNELDFIAYITSPFHALGVDAYVYALFKKKSKNLNGLIFVNSHPKDGIVVNETNFRCMKFANVKLVYVQNSYSLNGKNLFQLSQSAIGLLMGFCKVVVNRGLRKKDLHLICVMDISISLFWILNNKKVMNKYSPTFVSIDEGIGSYMNEDVWKLVRKYDDPNKNPNNKTLRYMVAAKFFNKLLYLTKHCIEIKNRYILIQQIDGLIPNTENIEAYKEVLFLGTSDPPECIRPLLTKKWAVVATQPLVDYDQITAENYIIIIKEAIKILEEKGFEIALKLHPRESYDIYKTIAEKEDIVIVPKSTTLEDILQFHPHVIIGFTSTVLVTSNLFYGILPISLIDLILQSTNDPLLDISTKQFKEKFGNIVHFVDSKEKLVKKLDELNRV